MKSFPCTQCGACCKIVWSNKYFRDRGMLKADGSCIHLQPNNTCEIYDDRPECCNFNQIYRESGLINIVPIEIFHDHTIRSSCQLAIEATGTDPAMIPQTSYEEGSMLGKICEYLESVGASVSIGSILPTKSWHWSERDGILPAKLAKGPL